MQDQPTDVIEELHWGTLKDWAELVRLPNIFTVLSNSMAAAILTSGTTIPWLTLVLVLIASVMSYWGGMILNDVADLAEDRLARSQRPIARGAISSVIAGHIGNSLLLVAPILVLLATNLNRQQPLWMGVAFIAAVALSLCIRAYDSPIKANPIGPILMGLCRSLNILMIGCSMLAVAPVESQIPRSLIVYAAGIGVYILGITIFARREEGDSQPAGLSFGLILEVAGLALIAGVPWLSGEDEARWQLDPYRLFPLLIGLVGLTVVNRGFQALNHPVPRKVQLAVKHAILTLILLDASIAAVSSGTWYGIAVVALLLPAMVLGSRFRST